MAISHMHGNNGIAGSPNGTFYVADCLGGPIRVLERQSDDSLVVTDLIHVGGYLFFFRLGSEIQRMR
jgi:hypothetical protein